MAKNKNKQVVVIDVFGTIKESILKPIGDFATGASVVFALVAPYIIAGIVAYKLIMYIIYCLKKYLHRVFTDTTTDEMTDITNCDHVQLAESIVTNTKNGYTICKSDSAIMSDTRYNKIYTSITYSNSKMQTLKRLISALQDIPVDDMNAKFECRSKISDLLEYMSLHDTKLHKSYIFLTDEQDELLNEYTFSVVTLRYGLLDRNLNDAADFYDFDERDTKLINLFNDKTFVNNLRKCCILKTVISKIGT